jgi:TonB family protein
MDKVTQLLELKRLFDNGLLTKEEFDKVKVDLISQQMDSSIVQNNDAAESTNTHGKQEVIEKIVDRNEKDISDVEVDKSSEIDYVKNLEDLKTNHSYGRYIIGILLFIGFVGVSSYNFYFKEKWGKESEESGQTEESMKIDIKNTSEVKNFLLGKWTYTELAASDSENKYYRIEITETHIIFNWKLGWNSKFNSDDEEVYEYELTDVYPGDNEGNFERFISVVDDKSLGYRMIDPLKIRQNYDGTIGLCIPGHIYEFERVNQGSKDSWTSNTSNLKSNKTSSESDNEMDYNDESEAEYNRQQEQAEYESSQAYNNSIETKNETLKSSQIQNDSKSNQTTISLSNSNKSVITEPEPSNGYIGLMSYIQKNMNYPQSAIENGIEGKVYVEFYVESDGKISDARVTRGVTAELNTEALRVVKGMPKWIPGEVDGIKTRLKYTLPINFSTQ